MLMAKKLASFSVEDDDQILLVFSDGVRRTVKPTDLKRLLSAADLANVERSLKLRKAFLDTHWPRTSGVFLLAIVSVGMLVGGQNLIKLALPGSGNNKPDEHHQEQRKPEVAPNQVAAPENAPAPESAPRTAGSSAPSQPKRSGTPAPKRPAAPSHPQTAGTPATPQSSSLGPSLTSSAPSQPPTTAAPAPVQSRGSEPSLSFADSEPSLTFIGSEPSLTLDGWEPSLTPIPSGQLDPLQGAAPDLQGGIGQENGIQAVVGDPAAPLTPVQLPVGDVPTE